MGIAFFNLHRHKEAAQSYLTALALNPSATHVWSYVRRLFRDMQRPDLVSKTHEQDVGLFQDEFEFMVLE